jgi:hypothetical protein
VLTSWDEGSLRVLTDDAFKPVSIPYPKGFTGYGWGSKQFGFQAHDGEWLVPSGGGVLRFSAAEIGDLPRAKLKALYDYRSGLHCLDVARAFEDSSGDVWVACMYPQVALTRWSRKSDEFHTFGPAENWDAKTMITVIREPHPGEIWAITTQGFSRFRNGRFEAFPLGENAGSVQDALFDPVGRMWLATARAGLLRCDHPQAPHPVFQPYTVKEGLLANSVRSLAIDRQGFLYAGTVRGVDRIDPTAPVAKQYIRHFTVADGLPNSENSVAFTDSGGRIWFGTLGGWPN